MHRAAGTAAGQPSPPRLPCELNLGTCVPFSGTSDALLFPSPTPCSATPGEPSPVFGELKSLVARTSGIADVVRHALQPSALQIDAPPGHAARFRLAGAKAKRTIALGDMLFAMSRQRVFKTRTFARWAGKVGLADEALWRAVE